VFSTLQSAGWDFDVLRDSSIITTHTEMSKIAHTGSGPIPSWDLNYPALVSLMNGQYYIKYHGVFGMMCTPVMTEATWNKVIGWLGKSDKELADKEADGKPYSTNKPLKCTEQADAFLSLLKEMDKKPHEYVTPEDRFTTNSIEGFHGLAFKYHGKRVDLHHSHCTCKTNMVICHKVINICTVRHTLNV